MVMVIQQGPSPYDCYRVHPYSTYLTDMNYSTSDGPMHSFDSDPPADTETDQ